MAWVNPASPATLSDATSTWAQQVAADLAIIGSAQVAFTVSLTATTTNPTLGTGSSTVGRYMAAGKWITGSAHIIWGSAATVAGSGTYVVPLPVASQGAYAISPLGVFRAIHAGSYYFGFLDWYSATQVSMFTSASPSTSVTAIAPFAWGANDQINYTFGYEAA
jgi:hypothetical protein